jgi:DnaJ-class molecular chaperone
MRKLALPILIAVGVIFLMIGVMWAQDEPLVLDNKYGKVTFSHQKHAEKKCEECHHTLEEGETSPESCHECHNEGAEITAKQAFHNTCQGCHKKVAKGPTKCKECHVK